MLQEVHQDYDRTFKRSNWLVRLELLYLGLIPLVLLGVSLCLIWFYLTY